MFAVELLVNLGHTGKQGPRTLEDPKRTRTLEDPAPTAISLHRMKNTKSL